MYRTELMEQILKSPEAQRIVQMISPVYGDAYTALWLFQAIGQEMDRIETLSDEYILQTVPWTATWSLDFWEQNYGITQNRDLDIEKRRQRLLSKMRDRAPVNPRKLEYAIQAASLLEVQARVLENTGKNQFTVEVEPPVDADDKRRIKETIDRLKPAHLIYLFRKIMHISGQNRNELDFVRLVIHWRASNWKRSPIKFNAAVNFDGSIRWDQQVMPQNTSRIRIRTAARNENQIKPKMFFFSSFQNQNSVETKPAVRFHAKNENAVRGSEIGIYTHEKNRQGNSAQLITNISFLFNGKKNFDGRKKFNSGVTVDL